MVELALVTCGLLAASGAAPLTPFRHAPDSIRHEPDIQRSAPSSHQGRLRLPPQAARTEGPPRIAAAPTEQSREAHRSARPHHSPRAMRQATQPMR
jgi:hypothetical protein